MLPSDIVSNHYPIQVTLCQPHWPLFCFLNMPSLFLLRCFPTVTCPFIIESIPQTNAGKVRLLFSVFVQLFSGLFFVVVPLYCWSFLFLSIHSCLVVDFREGMEAGVSSPILRTSQKNGCSYSQMKVGISFSF